MTQTTAVDLGALLKRSNFALQATRKANADFGAALDQAQQAPQSQVQDKPQETARQDQRPSDRTAEQPTNHEDAFQKPGTAQNDAQANAQRSQQADANASAKTDANASAKADANASAKADANASAKTDANASAKADANASAKADANASAKADSQVAASQAVATKGKHVDPKALADAQAQAMLALLVATPLVSTQTMQQQATQAATPAQAIGTDSGTQAQTPAQQAQSAQTQATQAQLQALKQLDQAQQASPQAGQPGQGSSPSAQPLPQILAQASKDLGTIKVETASAVKPDMLGITTIAAKGPAANLMVQLLDSLKQQETVHGSNTQTQALDGAHPTETSASLAVLLQTAGEQSQQQSQEHGSAQPDANQLLPLLNADAPPKADEAKLAFAQQVEGPPKPEDVMPQVLRQLDALRASQQNTLKLQLNPENLGKIEIKVTSNQGVISASISSDNQQVKSLLDNQLVALHQALSDLGIKVDRVEVALSSSNLGADSFAQAQNQGQMFQQQQQQANPGGFQGSGYQSWLNEEPTPDAYAQPEDTSAVNYVA